MDFALCESVFFRGPHVSRISERHHQIIVERSDRSFFMFLLCSKIGLQIFGKVEKSINRSGFIMEENAAGCRKEAYNSKGKGSEWVWWWAGSIIRFAHAVPDYRVYSSYKPIPHGRFPLPLFLSTNNKAPHGLHSSQPRRSSSFAAAALLFAPPASGTCNVDGMACKSHGIDRVFNIQSHDLWTRIDGLSCPQCVCCTYKAKEGDLQVLTPYWCASMYFHSSTLRLS